MEVNRLYCGDCRDLLKQMDDESVHCLVTSPPYWSLRNYGIEPVAWDGATDCQHVWGNQIPKRGQSNWDKFDDYNTDGRPRVGRGKQYAGRETNQGQFCQKCRSWLGSLGLEPSPELYVKHIVDIFREVRRVLRKDGTVWLNIGDSYAGGNYRGGGPDSASRKQRSNRGTVDFMGNKQFIPQGLKPKDLCLIPQRLAIALQMDGWWIRSIIIWSKPNPMPESVTDRPTTAHEYVLLLSKSKTYYYDQDAIREPQTGNTHSKGRKLDPPIANAGIGHEGWHKYTPEINVPGGRNKRTVWTIATEPYPEAHFSTYPKRLVAPMILAGTSPRACEHCGTPWERVVEKERTATRPDLTSKYGLPDEDIRIAGGNETSGLRRRVIVSTSTTGWRPTCACENEGKCRCIVLDPFCGSGTTCVVAANLGRSYIGFDASAEYIEMAEKRIREEASNLVLPL